MDTVFDKRQAERLAELLDDAGGGSHRRSHARDEDQLTQLVTLGDKLGGVRVPGPDADFRAGLRAQLLATAERDGIGVTAVGPEPADKPRRTSRTRVAIIVGIAGGTLAVSGISMASGGANPGDALYSVKRSTEKAQLALAGSDLSRGRLYLELARRRLDEAHAVRGNADRFGGAIADMDADTVDGIRLLTTAAMADKDSTALYAVDRFVEDQRDLANHLTALVDAGGRAKIDTSLALLDAVVTRSAELRAALACDAQTAATDSLGPLPQPCPVPQAQTPIVPRNAVNGSPTPGSKPIVAPSMAGEPVPLAPLPIASAASDPDEPQDGDGPLGELGRIFGDLLGS